MPSWILYATLSAVFASLVTIFGKIGLKNVDSTLATTVRSVVMAGFLVITSLALGKYKALSSIDGRTFLFIALSGIAGATSWLFYFFSLKNGPAGGVAALDRLSIVFVVILAALFLGEGITWKTGIGSVLILSGAILFALK
jgi:bacterial/archaeal transporter family protein